jgi:type II secretory pathway component PulF
MRFDGSKFADNLRHRYYRLYFGAKVREDTWRLLADLVAADQLLTKALETSARVAENSGRHQKAYILRDIETGVGRAQVQARIAQYVKGAEALVFKSIGKTQPESVFRAAAKLAAQQGQLTTALRSALALPVMLLVLVGVISYMMGSQLFPAMESIGSSADWPLIARIMSTVTKWFVNNVWWVVASIVVLIGFVAWLLPNWTGRGRKYADRYAPFSLYRLQQGTAFTFTVIELGRMGQLLGPALLKDMAYGASPYLASRLNAIAAELKTQSFGTSLDRTGLEFPTSDLIQICIALEGASGWIDRFSKFLDRWLEQLEQRIKEQIAALNFLLMILIAVILAGVAGSMAPLLTLTQ